MSIATATVSIAPYPVPMDETIDSLSESEIHHIDTMDETIDSLPESEIQAHFGTQVDEIKSEVKIEEPEEARVMDEDEVTKMLQAVKNVEWPLPTPTPTPTPIPRVVRQPRQGLDFSELAKDLPSCCPMTMPIGKTTLPAQHVIAAFFAGALIGCALVMCFSDTGVVAAE
jgi:hypothetical protein